MVDVFNKDFSHAQEIHTEKQQNAIKKVIKLQKQISDTETEIWKILTENWLNHFDVAQYKREKIVDESINLKLP